LLLLLRKILPGINFLPNLLAYSSSARGDSKGVKEDRIGEVASTHQAPVTSQTQNSNSIGSQEMLQAARSLLTLLDAVDHRKYTALHTATVLTFPAAIQVLRIACTAALRTSNGLPLLPPPDWLSIGFEPDLEYDAISQNYDHFRLTASDGKQIWEVLYTGGIGVRMTSDTNSERTGTVSKFGLRVIITETLEQQGNMYLKLDPTNNLGFGWLFEMDLGSMPPTRLMKNITNDVRSNHNYFSRASTFAAPLIKRFSSVGDGVVGDGQWLQSLLVAVETRNVPTVSCFFDVIEAHAHSKEMSPLMRASIEGHAAVLPLFFLFHNHPIS
jgi:hypothetical protein